MAIRNLFSAAFCFLIASSLVLAADDDKAEPNKPEKVETREWVSVLVRDSQSETGSEYYGMLEKEALNELVAGAKAQGFFKLERVFWLNEKGEPERLADNGAGYGTVAYFKVQALQRIIPIKKKFIDDLVAGKIEKPKTPPKKTPKPGSESVGEQIDDK